MKPYYLPNDLSNYNEIFSKDVPYDNIKSQTKSQGFTPLSNKNSFGKTVGEVELN